MHLFGIPLKTPPLRQAVFVALMTLLVSCAAVLTLDPQQGAALITGTVGGLIVNSHGVSPLRQGVRGFGAMLVIYACVGALIAGLLLL